MCAPSFVLLMATLSASLLLAASNAHAGTYVWQTEDANGNVTAQSPTYSGGTFTENSGAFSQNYYPKGYPGTTSYGTGDGHGLNNATCSGDITVTFTWKPTAGQEGTDSPPASVIVQETSTAYGHSFNSDGSDPAGNFDNGLGVSYSFTPGDNGHAYCTSTHYKVQVGEPTFTLKCSPVINVTAEASEIHVGYTVSIVNGNWDGPYYFHKGKFVATNPSASQNWENNTSGDYPTIEDQSDTTHYFPSPTTNSGGYIESQGSITPVWYWNGPDLGVPPPSFDINVVTFAVVRDYSSNTPVQLHSDDGQGNTPVSSPPGSQITSDSSSSSVSVESDEYAPGEGNGYWAIGSPIAMDSYLSDTITDPNLIASVELDATIKGGNNN